MTENTVDDRRVIAVPTANLNVETLIKYTQHLIDARVPCAALVQFTDRPHILSAPEKIVVAVQIEQVEQ